MKNDISTLLRGRLNTHDHKRDEHNQERRRDNFYRNLRLFASGIFMYSYSHIHVF